MGMRFKLAFDCSDLGQMNELDLRAKIAEVLASEVVPQVRESDVRVQQSKILSSRDGEPIGYWLIDED